MKRAVVTGGGGYVGEKLCSALLEKGYAVTALDIHFLNEGGSSDIRKVEVRDLHLLKICGLATTYFAN